MADTTFQISMPISKYNKYLEEQGINISQPSDALSDAASYGEFTGLKSGKVNDQPLRDLGITTEIIAECVPGLLPK